MVIVIIIVVGVRGVGMDMGGGCRVLIWGLGLLLMGRDIRFSLEFSSCLFLFSGVFGVGFSFLRLSFLIIGFSLKLWKVGQQTIVMTSMEWLVHTLLGRQIDWKERAERPELHLGDSHVEVGEKQGILYDYLAALKMARASTAPKMRTSMKFMNTTFVFPRVMTSLRLR